MSFEQTAGSGYELALAIRPGNNPLLVDPEVPPAVGELPPNFRAKTRDYTQRQILDLVIFYCDDFGILLADPLKTRSEKINMFMRTHSF